MKIIISITIGAVIGYITNYIAIKMLFRPYREIKFLGLKIPFTPGLIPKEKERIAKSVGLTIGTHLLSSETVADVLRSDRVNNEIKKWLKDRYNILKTNSITLGEILKKYIPSNYEEIKQRIKYGVVKRIIVLLDDQNLIDIFKLKLQESFLKIDISSLLKKTSENEKINNVIRNMVEESINSIIFSDKKIKELLPHNTIDLIKDVTIKNRNEIASFLQRQIKSPHIRSKVSKLINNIIQQNVGKFISMFISSDFLTQKVITSIEDYLDKNDNRMDLAILLNSFIENIAELEVNEITNRIDSDSKLAKEISNAIVLKLKKELTNSSISNYVEHQIEGEKLINFLFEKFQDFKKSQGFFEFVNEVVNKAYDIIFNINVNVILEEVNDEDLESVFSIIKSQMDDIIKNNIENLIELIDIPKIVEDRIKGFDVEFAEKIILEVANKELKAITWLGALLGGIIGIINPLLEIILK